MKIMLFRIAMFSAYFLCQPAAAGPVGLSADHQGRELILRLLLLMLLNMQKQNIKM